jgi:L-amino acid N-acyltransferase YncA
MTDHQASGAPLVRLARLSDLTPIVGIYNASIPTRRSTADLDPVSVESRTAWFVMHDADRRPIWVAELDGEVVAWLSFSDYYGRPAYHATVEVGVYVAPEAQGRRIAGLLVEHAIAEAPRLGVRTMLWITFAVNDASVRLAARYGFRQWGLLPRVTELEGERKDIAILGLELDGAATSP